MSETPIKIVQRGRCVTTDTAAIVDVIGSKIVALVVDFDTKWCRVAGTGGTDSPSVHVDMTSESIGYDMDQPDVSTVIAFPEFAGWSVYCAEFIRYTLAVCLVDRRE